MTMLSKHHFMVELPLQRMEDVNVIQNTVANTSIWIGKNHLKMNDSKIKSILACTVHCNKNLSINSLEVNKSSAPTSFNYGQLNNFTLKIFGEFNKIWIRYKNAECNIFFS